ncbi:SH3 domain-containing protein [Streptomyces sp. NPDC016845]|uniref:SH3 domain-containing protein n=1 Tax=Streptomyces sp. NPDC016845 TaxID=3364972 RepID=UPI0037A587C8
MHVQRIAVALAALSLTAAAASPALADGTPGGGREQKQEQKQEQAQEQAKKPELTLAQKKEQAQKQHRTPVYKGRVTAKSGLLLRDSPTRGSKVVRSEPYRAIVHINCKTSGQDVGGNRLWYLLTDGTWAWGAAKYIDNIGAAPRWC